MKLYNRRFSRPCKTCDTLFMPIGRYERLCPRCKSPNYVKRFKINNLRMGKSLIQQKNLLSRVLGSSKNKLSNNVKLESSKWQIGGFAK